MFILICIIPLGNKWFNVKQNPKDNQEIKITDTEHNLNYILYKKKPFKDNQGAREI